MPRDEPLVGDAMGPCREAGASGALGPAPLAAVATLHGTVRWPGLRPLEVPCAGPKRDVQLWLLDSCATDIAEAYRRALSSDERRHADRLHVVSQRRRFIAARATLRRLVADRLACAPERIELAAGATGRPEIVRPANDLRFNISHSRATTLIALSHGTPVGVDMEAADQEVNYLGIGRLFFCDEELRRLERSGPRNRKSLFFRLWTAKEAVLKLLGTGFSLEPRQVCVTEALDGGATVRVGESRLPIRLLGLQLEEPFVGALAIADSGD